MNDGVNRVADRTTDDQVDPGAVRAQVARILGDPSFAGAPQLSRLLEHLVENALKGELREVKEYSLGVDLFGRGASFDPRQDNLVRAHARRLRQRLEAYYDGPGRADPIIIEIPKGHYLAEFRSRPAHVASDEARLGTDAGSTSGATSSSGRVRRAVAAALATVLVLVGSGAWWYLVRTERDVATNPSILVLPFENLSDSTDTNYFASGVHEDLLSLLARIEGLTVIARKTAVSLAATNKSVKEMAAAAHVDQVLEGSVRRTEDRVRLTVQLIRASDEAHLWAETYDREVADIFSLQDEFAQAIAKQLRIRLDPKVFEGFAKARTNNLEAYDLYLRALVPYTKSPDNDERRSRYLQRAIELDPNFAAAYGLLANAGYATGAPPEVQAGVQQNIDKALSLDPENPEGLIAMSTWLHKHGRADRARAYGARAVKAAPGQPVFHLLYGDVLPDYRERIRQWEEAYRLDPFGDLAFFYVPRLLTQMRVAKAFEFSQGWIGLGNNGDPVLLGSVYLARGESVAGLRELRRAFELWGEATPLIIRLSDMGQADAAARWANATKSAPYSAALLLLRSGSATALEDYLTQWLAKLPSDSTALGLHASLQARYADEAFDRGDAVAQRAHLADALSAFRAVPFADRGPGFYWDSWQQSLRPRLRWLTVAQQAGDEAVASQLQSRLTETMMEHFAPEEFPFERGLLAALVGDRDKALDEFERAIVPGQWCLPTLGVFGVVEDRGGVFHGIAKEPRFQRLIAGERQRQVELNDQLMAEAPELLEPPHPSMPGN